jgi:MFS family permease
LHGFCFGFFLAVGYMYVDRISPRNVRGSMQNIYGVCFVSMGFLVGGLVGGEVGDFFTRQVNSVAVRNWTGIWMTSAALCAVCIVILMAFLSGQSPEREAGG